MNPRMFHLPAARSEKRSAEWVSSRDAPSLSLDALEINADLLLNEEQEKFFSPFWRCRALRHLALA